MNKEIMKKEFMEELKLFNVLAQRDLQKFTVDQVEDELIRLAESFYGARIDFDENALLKCSFVKTYFHEIISGNIIQEYLDEYLEDIDNSKKRA